MATGIKAHKKYYTANGIPTKQEIYQATGQYPALYEHCINRNGKMGDRWLFWNGTIFAPDPELNNQEKATGVSAAPTVTVGTTTTLPAGSQATVSDTDPSGNVNLNFGIPKGDKGDTGSGGGTAVNTASIVVVPNGTDDTNNLQAAIQASKDYGKGIELYGRYKTTRDVLLDKDHLRLHIDSKLATLEGFGIKRVKPVDNNEALNTMVAAKYIVKGLNFKGGAFEPGPSYGSKYEDLSFEGATAFFKLQFSLGAKVNNPYFTNCNKGLIVDYGDWSGANNFNSQSNHTQINGGRFYGHSSSELGIGIYAASGCSVKDFIIEGHSVKTGIDWDAKGSSVVKDFSIENVHYECPNGGDQFIRLRMTGNDIVSIKKCFGQYPVKFLDASSTSGLSYIEIGHVTWWRGKGDTTGSNGQGKMFTTNNVTIHFEKNHAFNNVNANMWEGTAPVNAGAEGQTIQAYHTYTVNYINPK